MISRQFEPSMRSVVQIQSLQSSEPTASIVGDLDLGRRRVALGVVPDEEHPVLLERGPRAGAGAQRDALGVGDADALALGRPAPVVERAGDVAVLDRALREVAAHVPAVPVEHVQRAVGAGQHDQLGAERLDRVRLAVAELVAQAEAVPAAREPLGQHAGIDGAHRGCSPACVMAPSTPLDRNTGTRYRNGSRDASADASFLPERRSARSTPTRTCSSLGRIGSSAERGRRQTA